LFIIENLCAICVTSAQLSEIKQGSYGFSQIYADEPLSLAEQPRKHGEIRTSFRASVAISRTLFLFINENLCAICVTSAQLSEIKQVSYGFSQIYADEPQSLAEQPRKHGEIRTSFRASVAISRIISLFINGNLCAICVTSAQLSEKK
jgi:hypothetical protein